MDTKRAIKIRKSMKKCKTCTELPRVSSLTPSVELVLWRRLGTSKRLSRQYSSLTGKFKVDFLEATDTTCRLHRDQIMRATGALYEIEFHKGGSITEALPRENAGRSWFTLFWKHPQFVKKKELHGWSKQATRVSAAINGEARLPRLPKKLKGLTSIAAAEQLKWDLESKGYSKVYLRTVGEYVVIRRDEDVMLPQGIHAGVPQFTLAELLKLRHFVGMKPSPEMVRGAWLLKKHLGAAVAR